MTRPQLLAELVKDMMPGIARDVVKAARFGLWENELKEWQEIVETRQAAMPPRIEKSKRASRYIHPLIREEVLSSGICNICKRPALAVVDHIFPISRGGTSVRQNLQPLCHNCNSGKRDRC